MKKSLSRVQECVLACAIQLLMCCIVYKFNIPNPNIVLFVSLSAVLVQLGYCAGTLCGIITLLYSMFFFSIDHSWIYFDAVNRNKLIVIVLGLIANIGVIGHLQQKSKAAIQEIAKLEAEKKVAATRAQILHNMSHDIRTPINGILGMARIIRSNPADAEWVLENIGKIEKSAVALLSLANNVLDMNELQSEKMQEEQVPFRLSELCRETMEESRSTYGQENLHFSFFAIEECNHEVMGNPNHIKKILSNLYSNAIRYTHEGGRISTELSVSRQAEEEIVFQLKIQDTGEGMSQEFIDTQLFELFAQEKETARTKYQGSGLGMPIVKGLVERINGKIKVESQQNKGTIVTLELPFEKPKKAEGKEKKLSGVRILLADDNALNLEIAEYMLAEAGAAVTKAENGKKALEIFQSTPENSFDVILMDVMMPEMDGLTATREIRRLHRADAERIPIFAVTASIFHEDIEKIQAAGMTTYLSKPLVWEKLIAALEEYCADTPCFLQEKEL